jgi:TonB family protein
MPKGTHIIHFVAFAILIGAFSAKADPSSDGKPVRGTVEYAKTHALYAPAPHVPPEARTRHLRGKGLFAVQVRPDGTVSNVQTLQSTGHKELDAASISAFSAWRFYPGQVRVAKIPIAYSGRYKND